MVIFEEHMYPYIVEPSDIDQAQPVEKPEDIKFHKAPWTLIPMTARIEVHNTIIKNEYLWKNSTKAMMIFSEYFHHIYVGKQNIVIQLLGIPTSQFYPEKKYPEDLEKSRKYAFYLIPIKEIDLLPTIYELNNKKRITDELRRIRMNFLAFGEPKDRVKSQVNELFHSTKKAMDILLDNYPTSEVLSE